MPMGRFVQALDLLAQLHIDQVRLLGGEPTLHPEFAGMVDRAVGRGFSLLIFSNGEMPAAALDALLKPPAEKVEVLINATGGDLGPIRHSLSALGSRAGLGFNIDSPVFSADALLEWIDQFGLQRAIRVGLAHPVVDGSNRFLRPRHYHTVGRRLAEFAARAASRNVTLEYDCGFVPCMFPDGQPHDSQRTPLGLRCGPIPDLLPDGRLVACYPLAPLAQKFIGDALHDGFAPRFAPWRHAGVFPECTSCEARDEQRCAGGCLAAAMLRFRPSPAMQHWSIPYIDQPVEFWQELAAEHPGVKFEVYFPLPEEVLGSGRPPQPSEHMDEFLRCCPLPKNVLVNPLTLPAPVDAVAPRVVAALQQLQDECGIRSATVSNLLLASRLRRDLPSLHLTASTLMDVAEPYQLQTIEGICDTVVAPTRIMRDRPALRRLRAAWRGRIHLLVNEACLPACPYRTQHFHEMGNGFKEPKSLCQELLAAEPWLRMTGAWVLPQHLHLFGGLFDGLKLAGRATLQDPARYAAVLRAYIRRVPMTPDQIGGGPASVLKPIDIGEEFYAETLECGRECHLCSKCREVHKNATPVGEPAAVFPVLGA